MFGTNLLKLFQSESTKKPSIFLDFHERLRSVGLATTNRYLVNFIPNPMMRSNGALGTQISWNAAIQRRLALACEVSSIPSKMIATKEIKDYGPTTKIPYGLAFDSINMSFYVGTDLFERYFFEQWLNCIQNPVTYDLNYYSEYTADVQIYVLPKFIDSFEDVLKNSDSIFRITLHEVYPTKIDPIALNTSGSEIMKLGVDFAFKYYEVNSDLANDIANKEEMMLLDENGNVKQSLLDKILNNGDELLTAGSSALIFLKNVL